MARNWTRNELIVAFNLYCKIPFGRIHIRNPEIIALAKNIGRTPGAVSWKLANLASLDPSLKARKISGASHGAKQDSEIWNEFNGDWDRLAFESESLLAEMRGCSVEETVTFPEGRTREAVVKTRVNQGFFRAAILAAYQCACCITGLAVPELLVASHIVPWSADSKNRTNPRNGLCLNAIHDKAFDCGLVTVTPEFTVKLSPRLHKVERMPGVPENFLKYDGAKLIMPSRFVPDPAFLKYHNDNRFQRK
jgi:putative restriction endonuclease